MFLIKNNTYGVIFYKDKSITNFLIVDEIDKDLEFLRDKKLITIEKYIDKEVKIKDIDEFEDVGIDRSKKKNRR